MASEICFWLSDICCLVRINRPRSEPLRVNKSRGLGKIDNKEGLWDASSSLWVMTFSQKKLTGRNSYQGLAADRCLCHLSWDWCKEEQTLDLSDCRGQQRCQTIPSDPSCFGYCGRKHTKSEFSSTLASSKVQKSKKKIKRSYLLTFNSLYSGCFMYDALSLHFQF